MIGELVLTQAIKTIGLILNEAVKPFLKRRDKTQAQLMHLYRILREVESSTEELEILLSSNNYTKTEDIIRCNNITARLSEVIGELELVLDPLRIKLEIYQGFHFVRKLSRWIQMDKAYMSLWEDGTRRGLLEKDLSRSEEEWVKLLPDLRAHLSSLREQVADLIREVYPLAGRD
jgi:hypothetical protein